MLFSGITFLYYFLPCVLLLYFVVPKKAKNIVLLIASIIFYAWGECVFIWKLPVYTTLLIVSALMSYGFALLIDRFRGKRLSRVFLILSVVISIGILVFFKYTNFILLNVGTIIGKELPVLKLALPLGVSFYTFQILSYNIDVYMNRVKANKNPVIVLTYVTLFPQLIAGPIVRYADIEKQLSDRTHSFEGVSEGIRRFVCGLAKKVLIANPLGELCEIAGTSEDMSVLFYWLYAISFTLQIYYDFSGYSDMAIGLGRIFGFDFPENFQYPYISKSIREFWHRWHISLGSWFRDYVYIPLGGSRVTMGKWVRNILIVWILTGFWHGASWNYIVWGLFYAVLLLLEKLINEKANTDKLKTGKAILSGLSHVYVMFFVILGFVIFNAANLNDAWSCISGMFGIGGIPLVSPEFVYYFGSYLGVLMIACIGMGPWVKQTVLRLKKNAVTERVVNILEIILLPILMLVITAYLVDGSFNPFLYFRF